MDCCTMAKAARTNTATTTGQWTVAPGRPTVRRPTALWALPGAWHWAKGNREGVELRRANYLLFYDHHVK
jgi:hypothetical protein